MSVQRGWQAVLWRKRRGWERFVLSERDSMHISVDWAQNREQLAGGGEETQGKKRLRGIERNYKERFLPPFSLNST